MKESSPDFQSLLKQAQEQHLKTLADLRAIYIDQNHPQIIILEKRIESNAQELLKYSNARSIN